MATITIPMHKLIALDTALTEAMAATGANGTRNWRLNDQLANAQAFVRGYFIFPVSVEVEQPKPASEMDFRSTLAAWEQAL